MRKRLLVCIVLSVAAIALLSLFAFRSTPRRVDGAFYWARILGGTGREIGRQGDRVDFFWAQHHGWVRYQSTVQEIDAARVEATRRFVDHLVQWYLASGQPRPFHLRLFELLTGYDHLRDTTPTAAWWNENRAKVQPTAQQVQAFLDERRKVLVLSDAAGRMNSPPEQMDGYKTWELINGMNDVPGNPYIIGPKSDQQIKRYFASQRKLWRFLIEAFYFPALIFYVAYAVTFAVRRLRDRRWPRWGPCAVGGAMINVAVMLPYVLGYAPYWMTTANDDKTILYNGFLCLCELPMILAASIPGGVIVGALRGLADLCGEYLTLCVAGTAIYGILGALTGLVLKDDSEKR